ncbi:MAG: DUF697 domain-containing protein [Deinococcales bacterium]
MREFSIRFQGEPEVLIAKAKRLAEKYGAFFEGDGKSGDFTANGVKGHYRIEGNNIIVNISAKPMFIPWQMVNATLSSFFGSQAEEREAKSYQANQTKDEQTKGGQTESQASTVTEAKPKQSQADPSEGKKDKEVVEMSFGFGKRSQPQTVAPTREKTSTPSSERVTHTAESVTHNNDNTDNSWQTRLRSAQSHPSETRAEYQASLDDNEIGLEDSDKLTNDEAKKKQLSLEQQERRKKAHTIIKNHVIWSAGSGFIPMPLADLAALSSLQIGMIEQLAKVYGLEHQHSTTKTLIQALTGSTLAKLAARYGLSFLKAIPVVGSVAGGVAMSVSAGASTYALGQVVLEQFAKAKTVADLDLESAQKRYESAYEQGRQVAEDLRKQQEAEQIGSKDPNIEASKETPRETSGLKPQAMSRDEIFKAIAALGDLRDKGYLSPSEFDEEKHKLLARI